MVNDFLSFIRGKKLDFEPDLSIIVRGNIPELQNKLLKYNIVSQPAREGVKIHFKQNNFYIFANYATAISTNSQSSLPTSLEKIIIYDKFEIYDTETFTNNFKAFKDVISHILSSRICEYEDKMRKKLIFLSQSQGRLDLSFDDKGYEEMYFNTNLSPLCDLIKTHENDEKACSILKDTIISLFFKNPEKKENIFEIFKSFKNVKRSFSRDYDLYNSQFSFESLKNELEDEKKAFLEDYAKFYADFMPKIYGVPLQIGAYILIISQALKIDNPMPIILFCIMIGVVGLHSNRLISISEDLLKDSINEFNGKVSLVKEKTNGSLDISDSLSKKISKFSENIIFFKLLNIITHALFLVIGIYLAVNSGHYSVPDWLVNIYDNTLNKFKCPP